MLSYFHVFMLSCYLLMLSKIRRRAWFPSRLLIVKLELLEAKLCVAPACPVPFWVRWRQKLSFDKKTIKRCEGPIKQLIWKLLVETRNNLDEVIRAYVPML